MIFYLLLDVNILEGDRVIAQAGQFFSAGYETVSAAMSFVLYELCLNKDIQNKVRSEVLHILNNHGSFCSDALQSMKYLQMVVYGKSQFFDFIVVRLNEKI